MLELLKDPTPAMPALDYSQLTTAAVTKLEELYVNRMELTNISVVENFTKLQILNLNDNQVVDISAVENLNILKELNIEDNLITDISPLAHRPFLEYLILKRLNLEK